MGCAIVWWHDSPATEIVGKIGPLSRYIERHAGYHLISLSQNCQVMQNISSRGDDMRFEIFDSRFGTGDTRYEISNMVCGIWDIRWEIASESRSSWFLAPVYCWRSADLIALFVLTKISTSYPAQRVNNGKTVMKIRKVTPSLLLLWYSGLIFFVKLQA